MVFSRLTLFAFLPTALAQSCVWKNGQEATDYFACDPTAATSSCCLEGEACVGNGLCYGSLGQIYRGACAGGWGNDSACPEHCNDAGHDGSWANLFLCPSIQAPSGAQSWWCGDSSVVSVCDSEGTADNPGDAEAFSLPVYGMLPQAIIPWAAQNFTGCAVSESNQYSVTKQVEAAVNSTGNNGGNNDTTTCSCSDGNSSNNTTSSSSDTASSAAEDCPNGAQIGEGVAIGVLVLLAIGFLVWALRERRQKNKLVAALAQGAQHHQPPHHGYSNQAGAQSIAPAYSPEVNQQHPLKSMVEIGAQDTQTRHELAP